MPKIDLEDLSDRVFQNIYPLLDSFELEYKDINKNKICLPCPIHGGDNETGISFLLNRKTWNCWTKNCHEKYGRSIFGFVQGVLAAQNNKECSFKECLSYITDIYSFKPCSKKQTKTYTNNLDFIKIAKLFQNNDTPKNKAIEAISLCVPSEYFIKRGFNPETLINFGVGECSIVKNRAMIPIENSDGILVGYIARSTKPYVIPKFIFSNGINKTEHLYNYNKALPFIQKTNSIVLVEGQGDVWKLYEAGVLNSVGCFGKDLSLQQTDLLLKSGATNLIVLLDDDEAGREAKFKIQRQLHKLFTIKFPSLPKKDAGDSTIQEIQANILPQIEGFF